MNSTYLSDDIPTLSSVAPVSPQRSSVPVAEPIGERSADLPRCSIRNTCRSPTAADIVRVPPKKVQRFLTLGVFNLKHLWLSVFEVFVRHHLKTDTTVYVAIDRTTWREINVLMVSVVWRGRAIPLYWHLMENLGNSDYAEQTALLSQALPLLADYTVVVLGDREFCSVDLARWLGEQGHYFCLRQKRCVYVKTSEHAAWQSLGTLGLSPGTQCFFNTVTLTKSKGFGKAHLAGKWKRRYRGFAPEEPWFILTNFDALDEAIRAYQKRFAIEMCHP